MTPKAFTAALATIGLSQADLCRLLDLNKATPSRWATGSPIPRAVELLLLVMCAKGLAADDVEALGTPL